MLVGAVVYDKIHDELHSALMYLGKESVEILHCSEFTHDSLIVSYVIAVVIIRRIIDGAAPDGVNSERFEVVKLFDYTAEVAYSVAVRILERSRIYLIKDRLFPPLMLNGNVSRIGNIRFTVEHIYKGVYNGVVKFAHGYLFERAYLKLTYRRLCDNGTV